jgi:hypothetical protein
MWGEELLTMFASFVEVAKGGNKKNRNGGAIARNCNPRKKKKKRQGKK